MTSPLSNWGQTNDLQIIYRDQRSKDRSSFSIRFVPFFFIFVFISSTKLNLTSSNRLNYLRTLELGIRFNLHPA